MRSDGKGVGETEVSPWRRVASEASVENREVLEVNLHEQRYARGDSLRDKRARETADSKIATSRKTISKIPKFKMIIPKTVKAAETEL